MKTIQEKSQSSIILSLVDYVLCAWKKMTQMSSTCLVLLVFMFVVMPMEAKKIKYPNGDYYEGKCKKKQPHGLGVMKYANGTTYEGEWVMGKRSGNGTFHSSDGTYTGRWEDDVFVEGKWASEKTEQRFEGTWEPDFKIKTGSGVMIYDGTAFNSRSITLTGDFIDGNFRHGTMFGTCSYLQGDWTEQGTMREGIYMHFDETQYVNGTVKDGVFYSGQAIGNISDDIIFDRHLANGKTISGHGYVAWGNELAEEKPKQEYAEYYDKPVTSELKYYQSYQIDPGVLPKGLKKIDWEDAVRRLTGSYPIDLDPVDQTAERQRQESIKLKNKIIRSMAEFEAKAIKPQLVKPRREYVYAFDIQSDSVFFSNDDTQVAFAFDIQPSQGFKEYMEEQISKLQDIEERKLKEQQKKIEDFYHAHLEGCQFTAEMPLTDYLPESQLFYDFHALMTKFTLQFTATGEATLRQNTYIDSKKLKRYDRGYLIQQGMFAKEFTKTETGKYDIVDGRIVFEKHNFVLDANGTLLHETTGRLKLQKTYDN